MRELKKDEIADLISQASGEYPDMHDSPVVPHEFTLESNETALDLFGELDEDVLYCHIVTEICDEHAMHNETLLFERRPSAGNPGWAIEGKYHYPVNHSGVRGYFEGSIAITNDATHEEMRKLIGFMHAKRTAILLNAEISQNVTGLVNMIKAMSHIPEEVGQVVDEYMKGTREIMRAAVQHGNNPQEQCENGKVAR